MVAPSAGEASRRQRGELLDASPATARRVVFWLWGGASADPASLHDDDEGASWPSLVLQTSRIDCMEAFRRVTRIVGGRASPTFGGHCRSPKRAKKAQRCTVSRVHRRHSCHSSFQTSLQQRRPAAPRASKNKKEELQRQHSQRRDDGPLRPPRPQRRRSAPRRVHKGIHRAPRKIKDRGAGAHAREVWWRRPGRRRERRFV